MYAGGGLVDMDADVVCVHRILVKVKQGFGDANRPNNGDID